MLNNNINLFCSVFGASLTLTLESKQNKLDLDSVINEIENIVKFIL